MKHLKYLFLAAALILLTTNTTATAYNINLPIQNGAYGLLSPEQIDNITTKIQENWLILTLAALTLFTMLIAFLALTHRKNTLIKKILRG